LGGGGDGVEQTSRRPVKGRRRLVQAGGEKIDKLEGEGWAILRPHVMVDTRLRIEAKVGAAGARADIGTGPQKVGVALVVELFSK